MGLVRSVVDQSINSITVLGLHFVRSAATGNDGPWCYHRAFDRVM